MNNKETFFWYDLETFGLLPTFDRIAQFAGQRTDMDLNPIGPEIILYCKLSKDYLPDPLACLITGITPDEVNAKGKCESEFIEAINKEFSVPNTCTVGFNSIHFDDEFIRNALYRNFLNPYQREWKNRNSRWDILDLVRACHDLRPKGFVWPEKNPNTQNPVFKLTSLTEANKINQEGAHDAMVDVRATIAIADLIKKKQPKLFEYSFAIRKKERIKEMLGKPFATPVIMTAAAFTNPNGCSTLICPITTQLEDSNTILCFDLAYDIEPLFTASEEDLLKTPGLVRVAVNKCPMLSPLSVLNDKLATKLGIDKKLCLSRYEKLKQHNDLIIKLRSIKDNFQFQTIEDTDFQLYSGGFFSDRDYQTFSIIRQAPPEQRLLLSLNYQDTRIPEMLFRHVARNYPEVLTNSQKEQFKSFCANRILCPPGNSLCNLQFFERKIQEKLESNDVSPKEKLVLSSLKNYGIKLKDSLFK
ncbi:MAG: exodeoxyribonuclease I [Sphaerochaetaceae bacterium]